MKTKIFKICIIVIASLSWLQVLGQEIQIPYLCGFEEDEDLSSWVLNYNTPNAVDKWMIGSAVHNSGKRSLYISSDGVNPVYGNQPNIVVAYMRFKFPTSTSIQNYDLSFDWCGIGDSTNSKLYVIVCPEILLTNTSASNYYNLDKIVNENYGILPNTVINQCYQLGDSKEHFVCGSETWQNVALSNSLNVSVSSSQRTFAVVFIWENNNRDATIRRSGICIDNIQISSAALKTPQNLTVEPLCDDSAMLVSWESGLSRFEVEYRQVGSSTWRHVVDVEEGIDGFTRDGIQCSYIIHRIDQGTYDIRVRGYSYDAPNNEYLYSAYASKTNVIIYCPCFDYTDLYASNVVCTFGYNPNGNHPEETPYSYIGVIDYGANVKESRHTIHSDASERDPRTDNGLRTVPSGAFASVRLGNWDTRGEAESITYSYVVDTASQELLLIQYAVVLESSGHNQVAEPSFSIELLDENGNLIKSIRTIMSTTSNPSGWNITEDGKIFWRNWTTTGLNLSKYHGQTIRIRFTTMDCAQNAHFGYAYFTLGCAKAHIETECQGNTTKLSCYPKKGFTYEWFDEAGLLVSTEREIVVGPNPRTYTCRASLIEEPNVYLEASTTTSSCLPIPEFTEVQPSPTTATFTWSLIANGYTYTLRIYMDFELTIPFCDILFDQLGHFVNRIFHSPSRYQMPQEEAFSYTVTDLTPGTQYYFKMIVSDENEQVIETDLGTFQTPSSATSIEQVIKFPNPQIFKFVKDNQLFILRGDKVYTVTGQEVR